MRIYAAYPDELRIVSEADDPDDAGADVRSVGIDGVECVAAAGDRVIVGTDGGVLSSADGGRSFDRPDGVDAAVTAVAVGPDGTAWAGTEPSTVHRSTDGGETWTERPGVTDLPSADTWAFPPRPETHHVRWIEVDPADPSSLYVAIEAGALLRTPDGGETWLDRVSGGPRDTHGMTTHPDAPGRAWSAAGDGFFETADGGESWTRHEEGLSGTYCWSVAVDPGDPDRLLLSAARGPRSAHRTPGESHVYRREGDGWWHRLESEDLPTGRGVTRPVLAADRTGTVAAASNEGIFTTVDWAGTWTRAADAPARATTCRGLAVA